MRTVGIGIQDFGKLREEGVFYVDKTKFLKEWWESKDEVTLITRPRRFGKTLTMSMVERFFSVYYAGKQEIFEGLEVWKDKEFMKLQGTYPVISLSFANVKEKDCKSAIYKIRKILQKLYEKYHFILEADCFVQNKVKFFEKMENDMQDSDISDALRELSEMLYMYYGKKVIILLDEYDTPTQEAYIGGYWDELVYYFRQICSSAFKTNPFLERGILTGITRISKESIFSDLNNMKVITMTSSKYADIFGFTEKEVFAALNEMELNDKNDVKNWYDGYVIGDTSEIYNPWSIINYLDEKKIDTYWANTSSNALVSKLIQEGTSEVKKNVESLLLGKSIIVPIDEEIIFSKLNKDENAIWSLLLAAGYLKVIHKESILQAKRKKINYELKLTNMEIMVLFKDLVSEWFDGERTTYTGFIGALLSGNTEDMNEYLNEISEKMFSYFDINQKEPEKFYHGFVLGILVDLENDYIITSNRESGKGRYDVVIEPKNKQKDAFIIEFKTTKQNQSMENALKDALNQIEEKKYEQDLLTRGFAKENIKKYGFVFEGKRVLIG